MITIYVLRLKLKAQNYILEKLEKNKINIHGDSLNKRDD